MNNRTLLHFFSILQHCCPDNGRTSVISVRRPLIMDRRQNGRRCQDEKDKHTEVFWLEQLLFFFARFLNIFRTITTIKTTQVDEIKMKISLWFHRKSCARRCSPLLQHLWPGPWTIVHCCCRAFWLDLNANVWQQKWKPQCCRSPRAATPCPTALLFYC